MTATSWTTRAAVAITAAAFAVAAGCAVPGNPSPPRSGLSKLEVGDYSLEPPVAAPGGNEKYGRIVESVRFAEILAEPTDLDPALTVPGRGFGVAPLATPAHAGAYFVAPTRAVLERNGMVAGVAVDRSDKPVERGAPPGSARMLTIMVLRFADSAAAQRAAQEIDAAETVASPADEPVRIPEYPAAHGHWRPSGSTIAVSIARESFVVTVLAGLNAPDLGALTTLARKVFDAQLPRLRDFVATPREKLAALPLDRDGMIARMVPQAPGRWPFPAVLGLRPNTGWDASVHASGVVYGPRASVMFIYGKTAKPDLVAVNGLDVLFRFPDSVSARQSFDDAKRKGKANAESGSPLPSPGGIEDIICYEEPAAAGPQPLRFSCRIVFGRYVATVFGRQLVSIQQRAAAQYALLVNSEPGA
ncbi:hypothetical protein AB0M22_19485 [Nocardia sp. NPDC051756]|uniref:DUF7373 family lipoprotein n=1 Tax=Nocardia sp. NPDC051756 TaxID=3154751 RepID=UPI0034345501